MKHFLCNNYEINCFSKNNVEELFFVIILAALKISPKTTENAMFLRSVLAMQDRILKIRVLASLRKLTVHGWQLAMVSNLATFMLRSASVYGLHDVLAYPVRY